ncbi:AlwI family type II restriction endonuclease [Sphingobacterium hotanense]|nr:AlwI family type II restriction endonuclease [Sphingobacterium hotanense]
MIFGLQLVDYREFEEIVKKIDDFRVSKAQHEGNYKKFRAEYLDKELREIYAEDIIAGNTKTRETSDASVTKFLKTKASNMRDYADACFRYLRATGLVNISHIGKSISIGPEKIQEVDYFLQNTEREPCFIDNEKRYVDYLGMLKPPHCFQTIENCLNRRLALNFHILRYLK